MRNIFICKRAAKHILHNMVLCCDEKPKSLAHIWAFSLLLTECLYFELERARKRESEWERKLSINGLRCVCAKFRIWARMQENIICEFNWNRFHGTESVMHCLFTRGQKIRLEINNDTHAVADTHTPFRTLCYHFSAKNLLLTLQW